VDQHVQASFSHRPDVEAKITDQKEAAVRPTADCYFLSAASSQSACTGSRFYRGVSGDLRPCPALAPTVFFSKPSELDQPRLVLMERRPNLASRSAKAAVIVSASCRR
jgi:hypothetical protein